MVNRPVVNARREATARLSAPERLDLSLSVTPARGWIALIAILAIATAVGVWSVIGEVATYVEAEGILLNRGGKVADAAATGRGRLSKISVAVGDEIEKGAIVAEIANEELAARYATALSLVDERAQAFDALKAAVSREAEVVKANNVRRRKQLDELETTAREMLEIARANLNTHRDLFDKGIVSRTLLESTQQQFNEARRVLIELTRDRGTIRADEVRFANENAARIRRLADSVEAAKRRVKEIEALVAGRKVLAPVSGQVIEIKMTAGAIVNPGQAVASIRTGTTELEVLLYVSPDEGKKVEPGMDALVSPATVKREEYGSIRGTVEALSPFPVSFDGMVAVLQNENLARNFSKAGPPYSGRISLVADRATASGFSWTSSRAANQTPTAGTLVSVEIKTRSRRPITLVIPLFKELLGFR